MSQTTGQFAVLELAGSHLEMGRRQGRERREEIERALAVRLGAACQALPFTPSQCLSLMDRYRRQFERFAPSAVEEVTGLAEGAGVAEEEAWFLQVWSEIACVSRWGGCVLAAGAEATAGGELLIGVNRDVAPWLGEPMVAIRRLPDDGTASLSVCDYGEVAACGVNAAGIAVFPYRLHGPWPPDGVSLALICRMAMEAESTREWLSRLKELGVGPPAGILLGDAKEGSFVNIEMMGAAMETTCDGAGLYAHASACHGVELCEAETIPTEEADRARMRELRMLLLADQYRGAVTVELIQAILCDHQNYPSYSICRHNAGPERLTTVASFVVRPSDGEFLACLGAPCEGDYESLGL